MLNTIIGRFYNKMSWVVLCRILPPIFALMADQSHKLLNHYFVLNENIREYIETVLNKTRK
jgi:hypothetical protein